MEINSDILIHIEKWQQLYGGAIGSFVAVVFALFAYLLKTWIDNRKERRENFRLIEISTATSLNDVYNVKKALIFQAERMRELTKKVRETKENELAIYRINFITIRIVNNYSDAPVFKTKSYYLHNKILMALAGINELNNVIKDLKANFESIFYQNELLVTRLAQNDSVISARETAFQHKSFADNLENFAESIENFASSYIAVAITNLCQIRFYNRKLRRRFGFFFRLINEKNKSSDELAVIDRIDKIIEHDISKMKNNIESKMIKLEIN
ncbi:hypothetical protein HYW53_01640 [Candidatus Giovannonibacteria bacterium]|nr:hypothetical protein [Candidatus Giovannonibacteria bacterium]